MYDIDPPTPILRLADYRKADSLSADPRSFPAQLDRYLAARADPWTARHAPEKAAGGDALVFRACGAVERVRALRLADGDLAYALDSAL